MVCDETTALAFPALTRRDVDSCQQQTWLPLFERFALLTELVPLSAEFVRALLSDTIKVGGPESQLSDSEDDGKSEDESEEDDLAPFADITLQIADSIKRLGGSVFPKLNWSAPKDAGWMSCDGTLRCYTVHDVWLLLKSSDYTVHDLEHAYDLVTVHKCEEEKSESMPSLVVLALKQWDNGMLPNLHFRCFVYRRSLIGISQRDTSNFYPHLVQQKSKFCSIIERFFYDVIQSKFDVLHYAVDVYLQPHRYKPILIDFSPFALSTDSLLFTWDELLSIAQNCDKKVTGTTSATTSDNISPPTLLRVIENQRQADIYGGTSPAYSINRVPIDVIDISNGRTLVEFAQQMERKLRLASE